MSGPGYDSSMTLDEQPDDGLIRCGWADTAEADYRAYHDREWGVPIHEERHLFELLVLEGAQAGLSWWTILRKREGYRRAFAGFDPAAVAEFDEADVDRLMADASIVRNRGKIVSAIGNAKATLELQAAGSSLADHLWSFVGGSPLVNAWSAMGSIPAETDASRAMSRDLKARGFRFVGPTICYALMQSAGLVNDHVVSCFRYAEVQAAG